MLTWISVNAFHWLPFGEFYISVCFVFFSDDATRVILKSNDDYINANYINVSWRLPFLFMLIPCLDSAVKQLALWILKMHKDLF